MTVKTVLETIEKHWDEAPPQMEEGNPNAVQVNKLTRLLADRSKVELPTPKVSKSGDTVTYKCADRKVVLKVVGNDVVYQKHVGEEIIHGCTTIDSIALSRLVRWAATGRKKWHSE